MLNLIKADIYRVMRTPAIYAALIIGIAINSLSIISNYIFADSYSGTNVNIIAVSNTPFFFDCSTFYEYNSYGDEFGYGYVGDGRYKELESFAESVSHERADLSRAIMSMNINLFYPLIFIVYAFICTDLSGKTAKNTLTSGVSKEKYIVSKYIAMFIGCGAVITAINLYTYGLVALLKYFKKPYIYLEPVSRILKVTLYQLPILLGTASLIALAAVRFRKSAVFIGITMPFILIFQTLVHLAYSVWSLEFLRLFICKYELQAMLNWLAYFPPVKYVLTAAAIGVCEIILSAVFSIRIFKKVEIV